MIKNPQQLFRSQFPPSFKPQLRRKTAPTDIKYNKRLERKYEKLIVEFAKYKKERHEALNSNRQTRFIINKFFKLDSNLNRDLNPIDIVYLRLFLMQHLKIVSYPKKNFSINFVQVFLKLKKL